MKFFAVLSLIVVLGIPLQASAQGATELADTGFENICSKRLTVSESQFALGKCVANLYKLSLGLGAIVALFMIVISGYKYMNAAGNAQQVEGAKDSFSHAFIGLIIILVAYALLYTINPDLVKFRAVGELGTLPKIPFEQEIGQPPPEVAGKMCKDLVPVSPLPSKDNIGTQISKGLKDILLLPPLTQQSNPLNGKWWITEAYLPKINHTDPGHAVGYSVDLALKNGQATPDNIARLNADLTKQDLFVLDEYNHPSAGSTGGHFHVRGPQCELISAQ